MIKPYLVGIGIFVLGFVVVSIFTGFFDSGNSTNSYYYAIVFSILFLAAVVGVTSSLMLQELRKNRSKE